MSAKNGDTQKQPHNGRRPIEPTRGDEVATLIVTGGCVEYIKKENPWSLTFADFVSKDARDPEHIIGMKLLNVMFASRVRRF